MAFTVGLALMLFWCIASRLREDTCKTCGRILDVDTMTVQDHGRHLTMKYSVCETCRSEL